VLCAQNGQENGIANEAIVLQWPVQTDSWKSDG